MSEHKEHTKEGEAPKTDEKRGFGRGGERGGDRDKKRGDRGAPRRGKVGEFDWKPVTKLGRLVKADKIAKLEEIYRFSIPIKESEIVDHFLKDKVKEEVM